MSTITFVVVVSYDKILEISKSQRPAIRISSKKMCCKTIYLQHLVSEETKCWSSLSSVKQVQYNENSCINRMEDSSILVTRHLLPCVCFLENIRFFCLSTIKLRSFSY